MYPVLRDRPSYARRCGCPILGAVIRQEREGVGIDVASSVDIVNNIVVGSPRPWDDHNAWLMLYDTYHAGEPIEPGSWLENVFRNNVFFHAQGGEPDMVLHRRKGPAVAWSVVVDDEVSGGIHLQRNPQEGIPVSLVRLEHHEETALSVAKWRCCGLDRVSSFS